MQGHSRRANAKALAIGSLSFGDFCTLLRRLRAIRGGIDDIKRLCNMPATFRSRQHTRKQHTHAWQFVRLLRQSCVMQAQELASRRHHVSLHWFKMPHQIIHKHNSSFSVGSKVFVSEQYLQLSRTTAEYNSSVMYERGALVTFRRL